MQTTAVALTVIALLGSDRATQAQTLQPSRPKVSARAPGPPQPGNVLVIVADDFGIDQLGVYGVGASVPRTPTIDDLAARGIVFRNAWAAPICTPSRGSLQTGRYGFRLDLGSIIEESDSALALSEITIPEMLDRGNPGIWSCSLIGKWHLNDALTGYAKPNQQGYDHFSGTMGNFVDHSYYQWPKVVNGVVSTSKSYATTDQVNDTLQWIESASEPWFCVLSFNAPHKPFHAPPPDLSEIDLTGLDPTTNQKLFYDAMVEAMDSEMGRLFVSMEPGVLSRTTTFFLGDNGTHPEIVLPPYDPFKVKATPYIGGVQVPFIVTGFQVANGGRDVLSLVHAVDIFATVAEIADIETAAFMPEVTLDSLSLLPFLANTPNPSERPFLYSEFFWPNDFAAATVKHRTMRDDRYKLIVGQVPGNEFFDLWNDPLEDVNLLMQELTPAESEAYNTLRVELSDLTASP